MMPIAMVFLAPLPSPQRFFFPLSLGLLLSIEPMFLGLHHIFKLATHIRWHLDHFHSLATSCVHFYQSFPIDVMLGIINGFYSFGLLVRLATNCPLELVSNCSRNSGQTFVSRWHTFCIHAHYFSMPNIPL
jgi:hypothetical protein